LGGLARPPPPPPGVKETAERLQRGSGRTVPNVQPGARARPAAEPLDNPAADGEVHAEERGGHVERHGARSRLVRVGARAQGAPCLSASTLRTDRLDILHLARILTRHCAGAWHEEASSFDASNESIDVRRGPTYVGASWAW